MYLWHSYPDPPRDSCLFPQISPSHKKCSAKHSASARHAYPSFSSFQNTLPISLQPVQQWNQFAFSTHADPAFALVCRKPWTADRIHESIRRIQLIESNFLAKKEWYSDFSLTKNQTALFASQLQLLSEISHSLAPTLKILMFCISSQDINTLAKNFVILDFAAVFNMSISKLKEVEGHLIDLIKSLDKKIKYRKTGYLYKKASNSIHGLALFICHITSETEELTDYLSTIRSDHVHKQPHHKEVL